MAQTKAEGRLLKTTDLGLLYEGDCLDIMRSVESSSVDLIFADPPFNLGKAYTSGMDDAIDSSRYLEWCENWLDECVRLLRDGGSLFLWNLPKWNISLGSYLMRHLTFRHSIAVDFKCGMPVRGRLYPAHYSLLYFVKGQRPAIFHPDRLPLQCCRHCGGEVHDYGGKKSVMNPSGVSLSDVWTDISPVRHAKFKNREANALPLKLLDRVLSMATDPGSVVLDPFGGSGTTYVAAELTGRRWIGMDLHAGEAEKRLSDLTVDRELLDLLSSDKNTLFRTRDIRRRAETGKSWPMERQALC
ncbi:DNA methylase N-4/N-6 domain-containing protein [Acetobacter malorum DSM 14337]|uniref:Methyltransferase n=1 Tax=Acetobacter malorum DSM 14337 TaxID=1307910 RepID=A0ABQ0PYF3_9PROT|nr:site-specific DNA-methyltransferase [Acetobacter malorum]KXV06797.1 hypothetical protein AD930_06780 [Acetobacter malorum]GBQ84727.1 DNA methylase N-4/N-6 domain-containing protein [Acetobacter malorum DSM 14337]